MYFQNCALLALATGFAAAKPIDKRTFDNVNLNGVNNGFNNDFNNGINDFNFFQQFNDFGNQNQVFQFREENLQIVDNGIQQAVVQQVQEVLVVDQQFNAFQNLARRSSFRNQFNDVTTVMLVVQQIQVSVDNGFGGVFEQDIFAQSAVVANRGAFATQTLMVFDSRAINAKQALNGFDRNAFDGFNNNGGFRIGGKGGFIPSPTEGFDGGVAQPLITQNADIQLFGSKPTWSSIGEDPAATAAVAWRAELEDIKNAGNNAGDNEFNNKAAEDEKLENEGEAEENVDEGQEGEAVDPANVPGGVATGGK